MFVLFYSLEELYDYCGHDYNGSNPAPFSDSKTIFGNFVYRYWSGSDIVECEIYEILF